MKDLFEILLSNLNLRRYNKVLVAVAQVNDVDKSTVKLVEVVGRLVHIICP